MTNQAGELASASATPVPAGQATLWKEDTSPASPASTRTSRRSSWSPEAITWSSDVPASDWDRHLAELEGHPLQSARWGNARTAAGDPADLRLLGRHDGTTVCMARVEQRRVPGLGRAAWMPKGPVYAAGCSPEAIHASLEQQLRRRGFIAALETPYRGIDVAAGSDYASSPGLTIVVGLPGDADAAWKGFPSKLRAQIRSAERKGVAVTRTTEPARIEQFHALCSVVSAAKGFELPGSRALMLQLLREDCGTHGAVGVEFLMATHGEQMVAGCVFMRVGASTHMIWGGYDRARGVSGASDLIIWRHVHDAIASGCRRFDMEGIDKEANPSTWSFKRKFGGDETRLPGLHAYALGLRGRLAIAAGRRLGRL